MIRMTSTVDSCGRFNPRQVNSFLGFLSVIHLHLSLDRLIITSLSQRTLATQECLAFDVVGHYITAATPQSIS